MHERSLLGPADVDDTTLTSMVAELLGADPAAVSVESSTVEEFPYDLPAITTAGRYVVSGDALVAGEPTPYELFVKVVQSWARSPMFAFVPDEMKELAEASVPWRTEALAYRSDLGDRLPDGLTMPRALGGVRPRREVRVGLARDGSRRRAGVGRGAVRQGGLPPRPARRQSPGGRARHGRGALVHDGGLRVRTAPDPGHPDAPRRRDLAAPAGRGDVRRRAPRPAAGRGGPGAGVPRGGARPPPHRRPRRRLPQQPAGDDRLPRLHADRLRLLVAHARRRRPQPAAHRRRPDRQGRAPATSPLATTPTWRRTCGAFATRAATSPSPPSAAPTPCTC